MSNLIQYSVFTKPWKKNGFVRSRRMVHTLGFSGIELRVRPGFQVEPSVITTALPMAQQQLRDCGVEIFSVATSPTPDAIRMCGRLGITVIRVMVDIGPDGYFATIRRTKKSIKPWCRYCRMLA